MPARRRNREKKSLATIEDVKPQIGQVWCLETPSAVPRLVEEIFGEERFRPLLVVSQANDTRRTRLDLEDLVEQVDHSAHIAVLAAGETTWAYSNSVPAHFRSYGGGTRLIWPYATRDDQPDRHPLFITSTEDDSPHKIKIIMRQLRARGFLPDEHAEVAPPWEEPTRPASNKKANQLNLDLSAAHRRNALLANENTELRKAVHSLTDQVSQLQQRLRATQIYSDPAKQLRHEIEHAWLITYNESERQHHPLAVYDFGDEFITSVEIIEGVEREKIVSSCVDVLTRRAWEVNGRKARQMRAGASAGAPYLVRDADGATAWRCNIQTGTASARRLMWWELTDGGIELAIVALHDDMSIR